MVSKSTLGVSLVTLIGDNSIEFLKSLDQCKRVEVKKHIVSKSIRYNKVHTIKERDVKDDG